MSAAPACVTHIPKRPAAIRPVRIWSLQLTFILASKVPHVTTPQQLSTGAYLYLLYINIYDYWPDTSIDLCWCRRSRMPTSKKASTWSTMPPWAAACDAYSTRRHLLPHTSLMRRSNLIRGEKSSNSPVLYRACTVAIFTVSSRHAQANEADGTACVAQQLRPALHCAACTCCTACAFSMHAANALQRHAVTLEASNSGMHDGQMPSSTAHLEQAILQVSRCITACIRNIFGSRSECIPGHALPELSRQALAACMPSTSSPAWHVHDAVRHDTMRRGTGWGHVTSSKQDLLLDHLQGWSEKGAPGVGLTVEL